MDKPSKYFAIRRSTRLPLEIPVRVTSLDSRVKFAENCSTVTVSAHGCGVIATQRVEPGTQVQLEIVADKQTTKARVLELVPLNDEQTSWLLGMELERPGNFWGIKYAPADWVEEEPEPAAPASPQPVSTAATRPAAAVVRESPKPVAASTAAPTGPALSESKGTSAPHFHGLVPRTKTKVDEPAPAAKPAPAPPAKSVAANKELPAAVMRRLLSECRLAAISVGACYVQTGTTFPLHAPVKLVVLASGKEHSFHGTVRVEHVGAGMGIEFSGSGDTHANRIGDLIDALGAYGDKIPEVRVELAAPDKNNPPKSKSASAEAAQYDSLLGLVLVGSSLKRTDFLHELEQQRRRS